MAEKMRQEDVETLLNNLSDGRYKFLPFIYYNNKQKIPLVCNKCGHKWEARLTNLRFEHAGCPMCRKTEAQTRCLLKQEEAEERVKSICAVNSYEYEPFVYNGHDTRIKVTCRTCKHTWSPTFDNLTRGRKCPKCRLKKIKESKRIKESDFLDRAFAKFGNRFDYSKVEYIDYNTPIVITCSTHGDFLQTPKNHLLSFYGCPECKSSVGESIISDILNRFNVAYNYQHTFKDCRNKAVLRFDFYLPKYNIAVEYDGIQHFEPIAEFGGSVSLQETQHNDFIKNSYCAANDIRMIRVSECKQAVSHMRLLDFEVFVRTLST